jgi:adenosylcobinamide-GDP ribazoletransferase
MKDSRIGAYGAIGIASLLALKCVVLAELPPQDVVPALLLAHPLSRLCSTALIWRLDYVKAEGKAKPLAQQMSTPEFCIAGLTVMLAALVLGAAGWIAWYGLLIGVIAAALAATWLARLFVRRIGGYTGDCLGAVQQVTEVAFYLALLASMRYAAAH